MVKFTEKIKKINFRKSIAYKALQIIMGVALAIVLYQLASLASQPDWSGVEWTTYFLIVGISSGSGLTAWLATILLGWTGKNE